ncbi:hypothetical protein F183_A06060 [Bryobacterales bacterium F-183]|nr:hypothetical protein F183_A06060 [Bryobacterales bacterium F-183]
MNNIDKSATTRRKSVLGMGGGLLAAWLAGAKGSLAQNPVNTVGYALPQIAYGGGWNTTLYFANTSASAATVMLYFFDQEGSPMQTPVAGKGISATHTVELNPRATGIVEIENVGDLRQGWVEAIVPEGVTGYGVFRQTAEGRADQEAVVPFVIESAMSAQMVYDDQNFVTGLAIVNPSTTRAQVTIVAYNASGAQTGNATLSIPARGRTAATLRELQGMAGVAGDRGWLSITVTTGTLAVLGLRFGSAAFTSIPAVHK